jgi:hypothetical protein
LVLAGLLRAPRKSDIAAIFRRCLWPQTNAVAVAVAVAVASAVASAEGVGVQLADDLARSGSQTYACGVMAESEASGFGAAAHPIVGKPDSYALRAEAILMRCFAVAFGRRP